MKIETTWMESGTEEFHRVVVLSVPNSRLDDVMEVTAKILYDDLGLHEHTDYIFDTILGTSRNSSDRIMIRLKKEEHFIMLKLHYDSN